MNLPKAIVRLGDIIKTGDKEYIVLIDVVQDQKGVYMLTSAGLSDLTHFAITCEEFFDNFARERSCPWQLWVKGLSEPFVVDGEEVVTNG